MSERTYRALPFAFLLFVVAVVTAPSCGGQSFNQKATKSLTTALGATNAARDTFLAYDKDHQISIVEKAESKEEAEGKLAAYRDKRKVVVKAFTVAYAAIAAAATAIAAVEKQKEGIDMVALITDAVTATLAVKTAVDALREKGEP